MSGTSAEEVRKHVKIYLLVFAALGVLTFVTVWVAGFHFAPAVGIGIALLIATVKGGLVAGYFMHLSAERKIIYAILALTVFFFFILLLWPLWDMSDFAGKYVP